MRNIVIFGDYLDYKIKNDGKFYLSKIKYLDQIKFALSRFHEERIYLSEETVDSYHFLKKEEETNIAELTSNAFLYSLVSDENHEFMPLNNDSSIKTYQVAILFKNFKFSIIKIDENNFQELLIKLDKCKDKIDFKKINFAIYE